MYINLSHICRIVNPSPVFSCLCELCSTHRSMVVGLRTATHSSGFGELNSDKNLKERVEKVRKQLEEGTLTFDQSKEHGKSEPAQKVVREKDYTELDKKWSEGIEGGSGKRTFDLSNPDSPAKDWFPSDQSIPVPSDKTFCSFCRDEIVNSNPTFGRGPTRFVDKFETISVEPRVVLHKTIITSDKLVACPNCCLKIKPKVETYCEVCVQRQKDCKCEIFKPKKIAVHSNLRTYDEG